MSEFIELMVVTPTRGTEKLHVEPNTVRCSDIETISVYYASPKQKAEFGESVSLTKVILGRPYSEDEMKERIAERSQRHGSGSQRPPSTKPILTVLESYESLRDRLGVEPAPER